MCLPDSLADLDLHSPVQIDLDTFAKILLLSVVQVPDVILRVVVHHDASIEGVEAEGAIVPLLRFLVEIACVETAEFMDRRGVLGGSHSQAGRASLGGGEGGHDENCEDCETAEDVSDILYSVYTGQWMR